MASPGREDSRPGLSSVTPATKTCRWGPQYVTPATKTCRWGPRIRQEEPVSRILSCAVIPLDAALPRTFISDLPGGFGNCMNTPATKTCRRGPLLEPPGRIGQMRSAAWLLGTLPSLFGLAPCGVYPAPDVTAGAVRFYRTISPLPRRWSFRNGGRTRQAGRTRVLRFQGGPPAGSEEAGEG